MGRETAFIAFALLLVLSASVNVAVAQEEYWHTQDGYSVELDGEGDAFVIATMSFEGIKEATFIKEVNLEIPGRNIRVYKVLQVPYVSYGAYRKDEFAAGAQFLEYELTQLSASTQMTVQLKNTIRPNEQTSIMIIYQAQGIATAGLQGLDFSFETIKDSASTIRSSGADVYVPQDMTLKGKPQMSTTYLPSSFMGASKTMAADELGTRLYDYYYRPSYQYTAANLDPGESFTVTGLYGKSAFMLYLWEYLAAFVIVVVALIVIRYFGLIKRTKDLFAGRQAKAAPKPQHVERPQPARAAPAAHAEHAAYPFSIERPVIMGIVTAFLYLLVSFMVQYIFASSSGFYPSNTFMIPFMMLTIIVVFAVPVVALFGPAVYMNRKYGWKEGALTFVFGVIFTLVMFYLLILAIS